MPDVDIDVDVKMKCLSRSRGEKLPRPNLHLPHNNVLLRRHNTASQALPLGNLRRVYLVREKCLADCVRSGKAKGRTASLP
jgi:hypothetical protein